jgi:alkanesulfonate monooxygenase SsuD/methylene tetrahydromethanopterin reductase-like flavin-dependent oxidoreductase (luciferase family)
VKFGITTYVTDQVIGPAALARAVEERGFDSLFVGEHMHRPVLTKSPYPAGGKIPGNYYGPSTLHNMRSRCLRDRPDPR